MTGQDKPSPFVFWAQSDKEITLRVDLKNVKLPDINLTNNALEFSAFGTGAKGDHEYYFKLVFYEAVDPLESRYKVTDRQIDFVIRKEKRELWLRLINSQHKPAWLKIDFDKFSPEDDDDDTMEEDIQHSQYANNLDDFVEEMSRSKSRKQRRVEEFRKIYLFLYNLFQFVGFLYVLIVMSIRYIKDGPESMEGTFETVGKAFKFCHLLQLLEIVHPLMGYTKGGPLLPFLQVMGRLVIIFLMIDAEIRMQTKPVVFYIFFIYSLAEMVRYPYYMLRTYNANISFITWLRYTLWIILYPLGFLCEGIIILRNIPYFEDTKKFSMFLPNPWNISFYFPTLMRIYLLIGFFPLMYFMMTYMYRQRVKMIGPKNWQKKSK